MADAAARSQVTSLAKQCRELTAYHDEYDEGLLEADAHRPNRIRAFYLKRLLALSTTGRRKPSARRPPASFAFELRYALWTIQRQFARPLTTAAGRGRCSGTAGRLGSLAPECRRPRQRPLRLRGATARGVFVPVCTIRFAGWPLLAWLSYPRVMARVTSRTKLTELKAKVASTDRHGKDGRARLLRSVQQSLRVEGYEVREEVLRSALRRATAGRAR